MVGIRTIASVMVLASALMSTAAQAQTASRYYMRERIVGMPKSASQGTGTGTQTPPTSACAALKTGVGTLAGKLIEIGSNITTSAGAQAVCDAQRPTRPVGTCTWIPEKGYAETNKVYWSDGASLASYPGFGVWGAACS